MIINTSTSANGPATITGGSIDNTPIGGTTPAAGAFTTISASGQVTSTLSTGTAPLVVASTTRVSNLNAASAGNADTVTTNANLTGAVTSVGNATSLGSFSSANLATALTDELGTGVVPFAAVGTWTPTWTGLAEVVGGGSLTYTGKYRKIGDVVFWNVHIAAVGGATTASTAGTTYINNMPYVIGAGFEGTCAATNLGTSASYGNGAGSAGTDDMYTPTWSAAANGIIISGFYFT